MCQREGQGHEAIGLVVGIAEHHALVAGALQFGGFALHAAVNVGTLVVNGREDATTFGIELVFGLRVADATDGAANCFLQIDVGGRFHLARHHHLTGSYEGFASHFRLRIESQEFVEQSVRDLVGYLIGMAFGNGL